MKSSRQITECQKQGKIGNNFLVIFITGAGQIILATVHFFTGGFFSGTEITGGKRKKVKGQVNEEGEGIIIK